MSSSFLRVSAVHCAQCGAALELTALVPHVICGHCQSTTAVSPSLLSELETYRTKVEQAVASLLARLRDTELWAVRGRSARLRMWTLVVVAILFLVLLLIGFPIAWVLNKTGVVAFESSLFVMLGVFLVATLIGILIAVITWAGAGRKGVSDQLTWPPVDVHCSGCGGDHRLQPGQVGSPCPFCRAHCIASPDVIERVVQVLRSTLHTAAIKRRATQRGLYTPRANLPLLRRDNVFYEKQLSDAYGSATALAQAARWHPTAHTLNGSVQNGDGLSAWLDKHWAAELPSAECFWQHPRWAIAFQFHGCPALVEVSRWPEVSQHGKSLSKSAKLTLLVASAEQDLSIPPAAATQLQAAGWEYVENDAGVRITREVPADFVPTAAELPVAWLTEALK